MQRWVLTLCLLVVAAAGQTPLDGLKSEPDAGRRADGAITLAETQFDAARAAYSKGDMGAGDSDLDLMTKALDESVSALAKAHKSRLYKRAEMRVSHLQRRMAGLLDDLNLDQKVWAEQTSRHVNEVREKLLEGAMSK